LPDFSQALPEMTQFGTNLPACSAGPVMAAGRAAKAGKNSQAFQK